MKFLFLKKDGIFEKENMDSEDQEAFSDDFLLENQL